MLAGFEIGFSAPELGAAALLQLACDLLHSALSLLSLDIFKHGFYAQAVQFDDRQIGSVGTLIGAALETAGHYIQSDFLDHINGTFGHSLGAFLYIIAAFVGIWMIAIGGSYKFGMWFLVGPSLFWWMVAARTPSIGANWEFGSSNFYQNRVWKAAEGHTDGTSTAPNQMGQAPQTPAQVSWFFRWYTSMVSDIIDGMISALQLTKADMDKSFINRTERYELLFKLESADPKLKLYTQIVSSTQCAHYYMLLREANNPHRDTQYINAIKAELEKFGEQNIVVAQESLPDFKSYAQQFGLDMAPFNDGQLTCNELWDMGMDAFRKEVTNQIEGINSKHPPRGLDEAGRAAWRAKQLEDVLLKFAMRVHPQSGKLEMVYDLNTQQGREQAFLHMINELSARALLNEMATLRPALAQFGRDRTPALNPLENELNPAMKWDNEEMAREIREMSATEEFKGKGDFLSAMLSLPYVQGLLLYFLSLTFPFFAFLLIVPGRHNGFMLWMGLWFWAKSWDFGFAIVMLVDEILYALLPHGPPLTDPNPQAKPFEIIGETIKTVLEVDPTYSINTYYTLIAVTLGAVPVLTGVMIKKGGNEIMHAVNQGYNNFTGRIGQAMGSYSRNLKAQSNIGQVHSNVNQAVENAAWAALADPKIFGNMLSSAGLNALNKINDLRGKGIKGGAEWKKAATTLSSELNKAMSRRDAEVAVKQYELNLQRAAYQASWSAENRALAADTMLQKYYFHDSQRRADGVIRAEYAVLQAEHKLILGGAATKTWDALMGGLGSEAASAAGKGAAIGAGIGDAMGRAMQNAANEREEAEKRMKEEQELASR